MYIHRKVEPLIEKLLNYFPVTAILGPRQCGKSTLASKILQSHKNSIYLDLELPSDLRKLEEAEQFFLFNKESLICIDEIQRKPELFRVIRAVTDRNKRKGQFLILGSAGPDLLKQSSETLAGRISFVPLTPFIISEIGYTNLYRLWIRGGFPDNYLFDDESVSLRWRKDFVRTYLERDIPNLGFNINSQLILRLWTMLAHSTAQVLNKAKLASSLGISVPTVQGYLDILEKTFMVRILHPYHINIKKRLIKSPKVFIRDTGILHSLLELPDMNYLMGHPIYGQSWEAFVIEQIISSVPDWNVFFYRTSDATEIDLVLKKGNTTIAVECKASTAPVVGAGFYHSIDATKSDFAWIICPFSESQKYPGKGDVNIASVDQIIKHLQTL